MKYQDFFNRLYNIAYSYDWTIDNKKVTATIHSGPNKGHTLNPITALAHKSGYGIYEDTREGTEQAASVLGISRNFARSVYSAILGTKNTGNSQVVRGKIRSALEV